MKQQEEEGIVSPDKAGTGSPWSPRRTHPRPHLHLGPGHHVDSGLRSCGRTRMSCSEPLSRW